MSTKFPKVIFAIVSGLGALFSLLTYAVVHGEDAAEAKRLAQVQLGDRYAYHVSGMQWSGNRITAKVTAYSDNEIRFTTVQWDRKN